MTAAQPTGNEQIADKLKFNEKGLIPAIAQQHDSGEILMMAWMNRDAVIETLDTGRVCYFSRSRGKPMAQGRKQRPNPESCRFPL